eukprot:4395886-Amphidinium_carterae.1
MRKLEKEQMNDHVSITIIVSSASGVRWKATRALRPEPPRLSPRSHYPRFSKSRRLWPLNEEQVLQERKKDRFLATIPAFKPSCS